MFDELFMKMQPPALLHITKNKVIACPTCNGSGFFSREETTDYHRNESATFNYKCETCNAEGRVVETKRKYEFDYMYLRGREYSLSPLSAFEGDPNATETVKIPLKVLEDKITTETRTPRIQENKYNRY